MFAKVAVVVVLLGVPARADTPMQEARALVDAGDRDYKLARFEQALAEYSKAYEKFPAAALLFNIAQCHRNLGQFDKAIFFYEGFLREARKDDPNRAVVEDLLRESRDALAKQQAARAAEDAHRRAETEARQRAEDETRSRGEQEAARRAEEEARRRAEEDRRLAAARQQPEPPVYRKWWFWSAIGGAVVAAGVTGYVVSRGTTIVEPAGSLGGLDRR